MDPITLLVIAVAPGAFWLWYFYRKDRYEPEPLAWILRVFLLGLLVVIPVAVFEQVTGLVVPDTIASFTTVPVIEECGKFLVVYLTIYRHREFSEPVDGIVYAVAAALGFATLENVLYVATSYETSLTSAISTGVVRALLSVPAHALFAGMWGYALGQAKFGSGGSMVILGGLSLAILFHGLFNLLLSVFFGFALLIVVLVPVMWRAMNWRIEAALRRW
jgi:RsiW-degrading membrane proteinase PrsW (M82 family)